MDLRGGRQGRRVAVLHQRRNRRVHRLRRRRADPARSTAASCRRRALGAKVEAFDEDGKPVIDEVGELVITEPMPSMPLFFWNDPEGERYRASLLRHVPRGSGATATGSRSPPAGRRSSTGARTRRSTAGRAHGHERDLPRRARLPEIVDALVVDVPRPGTEGWMPLFVVLARGRGARRRAQGEHQAPDPRGLLAAPRAQRDLRDRRGAAHAVGQGARGPREEDPHGRAPDRRPAASRSPTRPRWTTSSSWRAGV